MKKLLCALTFGLFLISSSPAFSTTISFDGKRLASDSQVTAGTSKLEGGTKVYYSRKRHAYIGCAGTVVLINKVLKWFNNSIKEECTIVAPQGSGESYSYLLIKSNGDCVRHSSYDGESEEIDIHPPCSIGSGEEYSMAGMFMGLTADESILLASKLDIGTNDKIYFYDIREKGKLHEFSLEQFVNEAHKKD